MKVNHFTPMGIFFRGAAMGAADIVPGVSGGTIAFISGIYETLLNSINAVNPTNFSLLLKREFKAFWDAINGNFLFFLAIGILSSALSLARLLKHGLEYYPTCVWSFFFGLILASALIVAREVKQWRAGPVIAGLLGIIIAFSITILTPAATPEALWFVFLSGSIAICAMILPGISGGFILVLLGKYQFVLDAVTTLRIDVILVLMAGAVCGLLSFSRLLSLLLERYRETTIALLAGFMVGSLNKVWPWKAGGENILPPNLFEFSHDAMLTGLALAVAGFVVTWALEKKAEKPPLPPTR